MLNLISDQKFLDTSFKKDKVNSEMKNLLEVFKTSDYESYETSSNKQLNSNRKIIEDFSKATSEESRRLALKFSDSISSPKFDFYVAEDKQVGVMNFNEFYQVITTAVFQNDETIRITIRKRGEQKAMITAEAFLSNLDNPSEFLDRIFRLLNTPSKIDKYRIDKCTRNTYTEV